MDFRKWPHADQLLDEALALPADERLAFVRRAAGGDVELAGSLEAVLVEAASDDRFLSPGGALDGAIGKELGATRSMDAPAPALQPGLRIEQYEVIALIGRGGMGEVYRTRDLRLERDVALKVLPEISSCDEDRRARFRREARVLAMLSHPGIAAIYGVAETAAIEALVLELVEGPTLADRLRHGAMPLAEVVSVGTCLADAIAAAHSRGILHRDLKPANIKVVPDGSVKVLDFGLAKALAPDRSPVSTDLTADRPHALLGTAAYMSPEQVRGAAVDGRADVWAFGCILFEMLTGSRAFGGESVNDVLARVLEREPLFGLLPARRRRRFDGCSGARSTRIQTAGLATSAMPGSS
jgi:serine/threonine protein kinase